MQILFILDTLKSEKLALYFREKIFCLKYCHKDLFMVIKVLFLLCTAKSILTWLYHLPIFFWFDSLYIIKPTLLKRIISISSYVELE